MLTLPIHRQLPFVRLQRYFFALSLLAVVGVLIAIWKIGINFGIDFVGGIKLTVAIAQETTDGAVTEALANGAIEGSVQRLGNPAEHRFLVKLRQPEGDATQFVDSAVAALRASFGAEAVVLEGQEAVGPRVGRELLRKGQAAILFTLIALLIYVGFRFDFYFAPGAIVALFHDVLIATGALVVVGREFDLTILAALLTIVGFSINDTIVIYDRIREHGREITPETINTVVDRALNDTLSRTIITSLTVLFVVVILYFATDGVIQNFAYSFIFGVIAGTYSSLFIATPIYLWLYRRFPQWRKA
ncbi:MAG: protein translocase subunit SecF [Deltaproteobacteria bacterium]|nr:protein translocase subunit SecF [Deltaproteobacteria bacterium]